MKSLYCGQKREITESPPVWGAWIEIYDIWGQVRPRLSPPVWGAWIEIMGSNDLDRLEQVAPRMGGVD